MADKDEAEPTNGSDVPAADPDGVDPPDTSTERGHGATAMGASSLGGTDAQDNGPDDDGPDDDGPDADGPDADDVDDAGLDGTENGDRELVGAGAPARRSAGSSSLGEVSRTTERKARATPQQRQVEQVKRTGPVTFVRESVGELRKVVYPTAPQLLRYFVVVLIFVLFIIGVVSLLDLAFGAAMLRVFG